MVIKGDRDENGMTIHHNGTVKNCSEAHGRCAEAKRVMGGESRSSYFRNQGDSIVILVFLAHFPPNTVTSHRLALDVVVPGYRSTQSVAWTASRCRPPLPQLSLRLSGPVEFPTSSDTIKLISGLKKDQPRENWKIYWGGCA